MKRLPLSAAVALAFGVPVVQAPTYAQVSTYANVTCQTTGGVEDCVLDTVSTPQTSEGCQTAAKDYLATVGQQVLARAYCVTGRGTEWTTIGPAYVTEAWGKLHPPGSPQPPMAHPHLAGAALPPASGPQASLPYAKVGQWTVSYNAEQQSCSALTGYGNKLFQVLKVKGSVAPEAILIGGEGVNGLAADRDFPVFAKFNNGINTLGAPVRTSGSVRVLDQDKLIRFTLDATFLQNFMLSANMELFAETKAGPRLLLMAALEGTLEAIKKPQACETTYGLKNASPPTGPITRGAPADPGGALPPN
jgi:hypothetical protein